MAFGDTVWYVHYGDGATTGYYAVPKWAPSTSTPPGTRCRQLTTPAVGSERVFVATNASTANTGTVEPVWVLTRGGRSPTDGGVTWTECTGSAAMNGDAVNTKTWSAQRTVSTSVTQGAIIQRNSGASFWIVSSSTGTMGASEPAFVDTLGASVADNTLIWTCIALASAMPAPWSAPFPRLTSAVAVNWGAAGNDFYLADNSAEISPNQITFALGQTSTACRYLSIDHTAPLPPSNTAALKAGASLTSSANLLNAINFMNLAQAGSYFYGITFAVSGPFSGQVILFSGAQQAAQKLESCTFQLTGSQPTGSNICIGGGANTSSDIEMTNCSFSFNNVGQYLNLWGGFIRWKNPNGAAPIIGTQPTQPIRFSATAPATIFMEGLDFTAVGANTLFSNQSGAWATLKNCKLNSGLAIQALSVLAGAMNLDLVNCDSGANISRTERYNLNVVIVTSNTVVRQGGANDGVNSLSHFYSLGLWTKQWRPAQGFPSYIWNNTVGSPVTVTLYGLCITIANMYNDQVWMDVAYMSDTGSPVATVVTTCMDSIFATNALLALDTSSLWCQSYAPRQNSHSYAGGNIFLVPSNPTRVFMASGAGGISAASEPAWYATANDGDHAADGAIANVVCAKRFKISVTVTPQQRGYITVYPKANVPLTFYLDPQIVLS